MWSGGVEWGGVRCGEGRDGVGRGGRLLESRREGSTWVPRASEYEAASRTILLSSLFLRQGLLYPKLIWNFSSCLYSFPSAGMTGLYHHT